MTDGLNLVYQSWLARHCHVLWSSHTPPPQIGDYVSDHVRVLPLAAFRQSLAPLKLGRFYPAQLLNTKDALPGPLFRVVALDAEAFHADFNHPLAGQGYAFGSEPGIVGTGDVCSTAEWLRWAGIDTPLRNGAVDYGDADAFTRDDESRDEHFYAAPRMVMHVDGVCAGRIAAFYRAHLGAGDAVLDLMASWQSHLDSHAGPITGLGMNEEEMADNPRLRSYVVHDLNAIAQLPFEAGSFAAVVNTVSIEYLTQPLAVLKDVHRILKPGGKVLITFSNRFFPPKAIALWKRLHPVERVNWVAQLLHVAGFVEIQIRVERGLKRDTADRYYPQLKEMDPMFGLVACKSA